MSKSDYRTKEQAQKIRENTDLLDKITGEASRKDTERGVILDTARFYIYEEIFKDNITDDNFDDYVRLYKHLSEDDIPIDDDGQLLILSVLEQPNMGRKSEQPECEESPWCGWFDPNN